jgi:hypothetical protein
LATGHPKRKVDTAPPVVTATHPPASLLSVPTKKERRLSFALAMHESLAFTRGSVKRRRARLSRLDARPASHEDGAMARKISETVLDFAAPLLNALGPNPDAAQLQNALAIAIAAWNAATIDAWKPGTTAEAESVRASLAAAAGADPAAMLALFDGLLDRKRSLFAEDLRAVGKWEVAPSEKGFALTADGYLPAAMVEGAKA